jgi:hypothetical protein
MPGMRPGAPMPNFMMPMVQQGQQLQRPVGRRAGGMQQPMPMGGQQQVHYRWSILLIRFSSYSLNSLRYSIGTVVSIYFMM